MKLAEALALRADAARRVEQLRVRIVANARFQEGEEPAEDARALLDEAGLALDDLEGLIRRINRTNAATSIGPDGTITDALARRDVLRARHSVVTAAADAAAGKTQPGMGRPAARRCPAAVPRLLPREGAVMPASVTEASDRDTVAIGPSLPFLCDRHRPR